MDAQLTYYDFLGVLPHVLADDVQLAYEEKAAVIAPDLVSGAPPKVIAVADRARAALELARQTLTDPAARERYDTQIGIARPGSGLGQPAELPSFAPARPRHVPVPDARGLFAGPARLLVIASDLRFEVIQLTRDPMPVEGLVIDQSPRPDASARRSSTVTVQVWHPSRERGRSA